jgi:hypothetical protein
MKNQLEKEVAVSPSTATICSACVDLTDFLSGKAINTITEYVKFRANQGFSVREIADELEKAYFHLRQGKEFQYSGYDLTELELTVCVQPVAERLTVEHAQWRKQDQDESYLLQILLCALNLGYNAGLRLGKLDGRQEAYREILEAVKK